LEHDFSLPGHAFRIRPLVRTDAAFVVGVRASSPRFINLGATTVETQEEWIAEYLARAHDYCFVVERLRDGSREGIVGIYGVEPATRRAEWGRFVLRGGSIAAVETAWLVYRCGFERIGLERMYCRTLLDNEKVVAFHDSCGLERVPRLVEVEHDGRAAYAVEHILARDRWRNVAPRLERLAARLAATTTAHMSP
jgi:RimJ/RimL family protein N-acetyltransferase